MKNVIILLIWLVFLVIIIGFGFYSLFVYVFMLDCYLE